ncbi:Uncharacterized protein Fot_32691 [Forsythia ovata]|uniref:Uncharacterized protein n=1 Tax=Forsythia ovata TaxID=205694 RepID=A0ABD1T8J5_9LAMI
MNAHRFTHRSDGDPVEIRWRPEITTRANCKPTVDVVWDVHKTRETTRKSGNQRRLEAIYCLIRAHRFTHRSDGDPVEIRWRPGITARANSRQYHFSSEALVGQANRSSPSL